jgi:hypothetical protein
MPRSKTFFPTWSRLLADALHDNFATGTQRPRGLRVIETTIGARRDVIRDPQQLATSVQVRGPLRAAKKWDWLRAETGKTLENLP